MDAFAASLEGLALAEWLRYSRWGYAAINATHILGLALLVGSIVMIPDIEPLPLIIAAGLPAVIGPFFFLPSSRMIFLFRR